jgi:TetR/AcrR family transcriptional regulator, transcriptional repressor for nem operon
MVDEGYASFTYRAVATGAGVTSGLVQYYFGSLDDLFVAVLRQATDRVVERLSEVSEADQPSGSTRVAALVPRCSSSSWR